MGFDLPDRAQAWIPWRTPRVHRFRHRREPSRRARIDFGELLHAEAVFERQSVGIEEIQEYAARSDVPAEPEHYGDVIPEEAVEAAPKIVDFRHHEVEVVELVPLPVADPYPMVIGIGKARKKVTPSPILSDSWKFSTSRKKGT